MKPIDGFQEPDVDMKLWDKVRYEFEFEYYQVDPATIIAVRTIPEAIRSQI